MMISIIIPYDGNEVFLRDCLDSLVGQSYKNFEIILVCDNLGKNALGCFGRI